MGFKELIIALLPWVSQISGLPITDKPLPTVTYIQQMDARTRIGQTSRTTGNIELLANHPWANNVEFICLLAHELTHHLQWANNKMGPTSQDVEPLAYLVTYYCFAAYQDQTRAAWAAREYERCKTDAC